ncbi:competence protein CoiA [Allofustis seminis]|uniref:competence protein CoiA n=1 Tax=Allofustis seminis TaxID=166939 RepID=UPI0003726D22|nr:competence protein CoiA family protein [Allofustis seminis]
MSKEEKGDNMLCAYNDHQELVQADYQLNRDQKYFCPSCRQRVYLKKGALMIPHFAHFKSCSQFAFSEGETVEHLQGKRVLAEWFSQLGAKSIEMEAYLPKLQQRPDVLVELDASSKIAVEFQCSPISAQKLSKRSLGYLMVDYFPLWIFGRRYRNKKISPTVQAGMFQDRGEITCAFLKNKTLILVKNIQQLGYPHQIKFQALHYPLNKLSFDGGGHLLPAKIVNGGSEWHKEEDIHLFLQRQSYYKSANYRPFFQMLYEQGEAVLTLPREILQPLEKEWRLKVNPFQLRFALLKKVEALPFGSIFSTQELLRQLPSGLLNSYRAPQLSNPQLNVAQDFLNRLEKSGVVSSVGASYWQYERRAKRPQAPL